MNNLEIAVQFSDLFEQTGTEGGIVARLIDEQIMPSLNESGLGLGDRFTKVLDQVKAAAGDGGGDHIRRLKEMMKEALKTYVKRTHDAMTAREVFHHAIQAGSQTMLTVVAAVLLANSLTSHSASEAQHLVKKVAASLSGGQVTENASGGAVGAGAIATAPAALGKKRKRRKDSIFAEDLSWRDLLDEPEVLAVLEEVADCGCDREVDGVLVDPTTAELVVSAHRSMSPEHRKRYRSRPLPEMIEIAHSLVRTGQLQVVMEEG